MTPMTLPPLSYLSPFRTLLVYGGAGRLDRDNVDQILTVCHMGSPIEEVVHSGELGFETMAGEWALAHGLVEKVFERSQLDADTPAVNMHLINTARPTAILIIMGHRGSNMMLAQAKIDRIPVIKVREEDDRLFVELIA